MIQTVPLLSGVYDYNNLPTTFHEKLTHFFNQIFEFAESEIDKAYMEFSIIIKDVQNIREGARKLMEDMKTTLHNAVKVSLQLKYEIKPFSSHVVEIREILLSTGADCVRLLQSMTNKIVHNMTTTAEGRLVNHRQSFTYSISA